MSSKERTSEQSPRRICPSADSHYASDRPQSVMYEMAMFRESRGLPPVAEPMPYRRPELKKMEPGKSYQA